VTPLALAQAEATPARAVPTGIGELDRVLGGGLMPGSATLIGGEPGVGKSTLLLQALAAMARAGGRCLLVSAEESPAQVRHRADRMGALVPGLWVVPETSTDGIESAVSSVAPDVLVVDSIQTVWDRDIDGPPGSIAQVRGCAHRLVARAKSGGPATVLVGHVTKEGTIAGPRLLEHLVDTVLSFEGDRHHALRLLRAAKHRFGATGELGLFEMTASGLQAVEDPGSMFLGDRRAGTPGSAVFPYMEGERPLLVEVQALVASSPMATPRRSVSGFDAGRLALLLAVLDRRAGVSLAKHDVYVSVVGGVRIGDDPGADLAVCLAVVSAATDRLVDEDLVVVGEVGLAGEIRQVARTSRRLAEAARLGFTRALVPAGGVHEGGSLTMRGVESLVEAIDGCLGRASPRPKLRLVTGPA
jgi:DNA repair protein RadA/Sms